MKDSEFRQMLHNNQNIVGDKTQVQTIYLVRETNVEFTGVIDTLFYI